MLKVMLFGKLRRARVSSQSWKRAMRGVFRENFKESELGVRTKKIIELVTQKILELDPSKAEEEAKSGIYNLHAYRQAEYLCQPHPSRRSNGNNTQRSAH